MKNNSWIIRGARKNFRNEYYVKDITVFVDFAMMVVFAILLFRGTTLNMFFSYITACVISILVSVGVIYVVSLFEGYSRHWQKKYFSELMRDFDPQLN